MSAAVSTISPLNQKLQEKKEKGKKNQTTKNSSYWSHSSTIPTDATKIPAHLLLIPKFADTMTKTKEMGTEDKIGMRKKFLKVHLFHLLFFSHAFLATVKF
jgi:hypothetical protein